MKKNKIVKCSLQRIDPDVMKQIIPIAKNLDRSIPKQINRFLRERIAEYIEKGK